MWQCSSVYDTDIARESFVHMICYNGPFSGVTYYSYNDTITQVSSPTSNYTHIIMIHIHTQLLTQCNTNSSDVLIWVGPNSTLQCCLLTNSLKAVRTSTSFSNSLCTSSTVKTRFIHYSIGTYTPDFFFTGAVTFRLITWTAKATIW